jgi:hypothetical protein
LQSSPSFAVAKARVFPSASCRAAAEGLEGGERLARGQIGPAGEGQGVDRGGGSERGAEAAQRGRPATGIAAGRRQLEVQELRGGQGQGQEIGRGAALGEPLHQHGLGLERGAGVARERLGEERVGVGLGGGVVGGDGRGEPLERGRCGGVGLGPGGGMASVVGLVLIDVAGDAHLLGGGERDACVARGREQGERVVEGLAVGHRGPGHAGQGSGQPELTL